MSMAPQELEKSASKYAAAAIRADSQGAVGMAISDYQNASDTLLKLIQLYPTSSLNKIYKTSSQKYQERIQALRNTDGGNIAPAVDPNASPEEQTKALARAQPNKDEGGNLEDLVMKEKPDVKWSEVIGLDDAKSALRESILYPSKRPDLFPLGWPRGMLLYGPPGTGKTMLAAATANELDGYFINVDAASMMSKWLGEAEKNVSKLFKIARKYNKREGKPVILFIDEVDSLLGDRNSEVGGEIRAKNQFLSELDGVNGKGKDTMIYVIGATNKPWSLDEPFLRRFQKRIYVALPNQDAREKLFTQYTAPLKKSSIFNSVSIAKQFDGYSASDIKDVCQGAQLLVVNELFHSPTYHEPVNGEVPQATRALTMADFKDIKARRKPSVSIENIRAYHKWSESFGAL
ncbi:MAG: AAA family ATPase [Crenarchaeota archaeon]|nr:AAA family ATPase [Thermoproteota archaeon]MDA1124479.1 AAA family ATPase [Thermoproteota archaeon]